MKRLQIMIDEDLDVALADLSTKTGQSKAALIRSFVRDRLRLKRTGTIDELDEMVGVDDYPHVDIDDVVYK